MPGPVASRIQSPPPDALGALLGRAVAGREHAVAALAASLPLATRTATPVPSGPILQRRVAVEPDAYAKGLRHVDATQLTLLQLQEYFAMAVRDEVKYIEAMVGEDDDGYKACDTHLKVLKARASTLPARIAAMKGLVTAINSWWDAGIASESYDDEGETVITTTPHLPNLETRYASTPEKTWSKTVTSYAHTPSTTTWSEDPEMWKKFAAGLGAIIAGPGITQVNPRGTLIAASKQARLPLNQLTWAHAKTLLPRPMLNLIFDLRYQLESGDGSFIDERTEDERGRKVITPNMPGTLRSWHSDSPQLLPANAFDPQAIPAGSAALHAHYRDTSSGGVGSSQKDAPKAPTGYAEYTGTGSNGEHNTKIVIDYIGKRVYLTISHYQYWSLITKRDGSYEFWNSSTQDIEQAQGNLDKRIGGTGDRGTLMSPWFEILMP